MVEMLYLNEKVYKKCHFSGQHSIISHFFDLLPGWIIDESLLFLYAKSSLISLALVLSLNSSLACLLDFLSALYSFARIK
jgi:hypothetical protein